MNVLVLGSGAREHALAWKLHTEANVERVYAAPGNPGIEAVATCLSLDPTDGAAVVAAARAQAVDLVVVGPEAPLVAGVADALRAAGVPVFGPGAGAAAIEGSKAFAKDVMKAAGVPTARTEVFDDAAAAAARALEWGAVVVKADGLAAGKGVVVASTGEEAAQACRALGATPAGHRLVLEERLSGPEVSLIALCDGERYVLLPTAQDHKRIFDGDRGPNTGGMGAYAPTTLVDQEELVRLGHAVIEPTLAELRRRGTPFVGALYAGLMLTPDGPKVLEFNCRLGDPETQPLMMQLDEPLSVLLLDCALGRLAPRALWSKRGASVAVVLAAKGYPEAPVTGQPIRGLDARVEPDVQVFHAGTKRVGQEVVTAGGRVLTVCAHGSSTEAARHLAYTAAARIAFDGQQLRHDIALKARA